MTRRVPTLVSFLFPLTVIAGWELLSRTSLVSPALLPPPTEIARLFTTIDFTFAIGPHAMKTVSRAMAGYGLAFLFAVPLGVAIGRSTLCDKLTVITIESLRPLPSSAMIPVALLFLGLGTSMQVAVTAFGCIWPILVATIEGARRIEPTLVDAARLLRFDVRRRLWCLYLPSAAPYITAGLRTSLAVALILSITAEMLAGSDGLGFYILDMERAFRIPEMFGAIVLLGAIGYSLNYLFLAVQVRVLYWMN